MTTYETKFAKGATAFAIAHVRRETSKLCPACGDQFQIEEPDAPMVSAIRGLDGRLYECPHCKGKGVETHATYENEVVKVVILEISIYHRGMNPEISYRTNSHEVRQVWEHSMFATQELADAELERRKHL